MSLQEARRRIRNLRDNGLTVLDLAELGLTDAELAEAFRNNEIVALKLQYLYLHNNQLKWVPFSKLKSLESLCLSNNKLDQITNGISELKKLKYLFVDQNQLVNSVETILKLKNLEISFWNGEKYISISGEVKKIQQKTTELEANIKVKNEADKALKKRALYLKRVLAVFVLFLPVTFCLIFFNWVTDRWTKIEPLLVVFSLSLLILSVALGRNFKDWLNESANELLERFLRFTSIYASKKHRNIRSEHKKLSGELRQAYDVLIKLFQRVKSRPRTYTKRHETSE